MRCAFSIADARTGVWRHIEVDIPPAIMEECLRRHDGMTFLRAALKDDRFDGRVMIMVPCGTPKREDGQR